MSAVYTSSRSLSPTSSSAFSSIINSSSSTQVISANAKWTTSTTHLPTSNIQPSRTHTVTASSSGNITVTNPTTKPKPNQTFNKKLSSFGIVMLSIGGILILVLIVCLMGICCHGRERGPEGMHVPHSNVKMKPWKSSELSTTKDFTDDTIDDLDQPNHSQSHHNVCLTNSPQASPNLAVPSYNNNKISTPTGTFRNLQPHSPSGDLGEFGRKLSLGRQAYIPPPNTDENEPASKLPSNTGENEPVKRSPSEADENETKGEQDDMKIHYV